MDEHTGQHFQSDLIYLNLLVGYSPALGKVTMTFSARFYWMKAWLRVTQNDIPEALNDLELVGKNIDNTLKIMDKTKELFISISPLQQVMQMLWYFLSSFLIFSRVLFNIVWFQAAEILREDARANSTKPVILLPNCRHCSKLHLGALTKRHISKCRTLGNKNVCDY